MVDEITPTYYASEQQLVYTLIGHGFHLLSDDALGIKGLSNDAPTHYVGSQISRYLFDITERSNTHLVLTSRSTYEPGSPSYLGAIVSNDRRIIYWVNNSKPLPPSRGDIVDPEFIDER